MSTKCDTSVTSVTESATDALLVLQLQVEAKQRLIGSGKDGCIFYPPLSYFGQGESKDSTVYTNHPQFVMKVMSPKAANNEKQMGKLLELHDPNQQWVIFIKSGLECCLHKSNYINDMWNWPAVKIADRDVQKEDYYKSFTNSLTTELKSTTNKNNLKKHSLESSSLVYKHTLYYGYIQQFGGESYASRLHALRKKSWHQVMLDSLVLLQGLQFMHDVAHIVHRDIKAHNIGYDHTTRRIRYWDFGLAMSIKSDQSLESICKDMNSIHFQIWSIDVNAKCAKLRTLHSFWKWLHVKDVRRWCMWFDYCKITPKNSDSKTVSDKKVSTETSATKWYQRYIKHCIEFWTGCDCIVNSAVNHKSDQLREQHQKSKQAYVDIIILMLKQNDVLSLGLLLCDFVFNQYIPYFDKKKRNISNSDVLSKWISSVLIPMIHPNFKQRIRVDAAILRTRQLIAEYNTSVVDEIQLLANKLALDTPHASSKENSVSSVDSTSSFSTASFSTASITRQENEKPVFSPLYKRRKSKSPVKMNDEADDDHSSEPSFPPIQAFVPSVSSTTSKSVGSVSFLPL